MKFFPFSASFSSSKYAFLEHMNYVFSYKESEYNKGVYDKLLEICI